MRLEGSADRNVAVSTMCLVSVRRDAHGFVRSWAVAECTLQLQPHVRVISDEQRDSFLARDCANVLLRLRPQL